MGFCQKQDEPCNFDDTQFAVQTKTNQTSKEIDRND